MNYRVIESTSQYRAYLAEIDRLIMCNPDNGTTEHDNLGVLGLLVESYEKGHFPIESPTPVEAIRFRMDQSGLAPRDLEAYIGSKSKVSEVLSEKVPLSLRMIRALHEGLGIPANVLLQQPRAKKITSDAIDWSRFPVKEMCKRGWVHAEKKQLREHPAEVALSFFAETPGTPASSVYFRKTLNKRTGASVDEYALAAWIAWIQKMGDAKESLGQFVQETMDTKFLQSVAQYSSRPNGPLAVRGYLAENGIALVIEPHLPRTKLDGAATISPTGRPIIGLTLRHDRIDSFWFTLLHELAHLALHVRSTEDTFIDDLDIDGSESQQEREADRVAGDALIPRTLWHRSNAFRERTPEAVCKFAAQLDIHPAIIAGRLRKETRNYRMLSQLVGHRQVRVLFIRDSDTVSK